jgi:hypothetical protein
MPAYPEEAVTTPPCICLDIFIDAVCGRIDPYAWRVEYDHHVREGHVASCHHGRVKAAARPGYRLAPEPKAHRGLARILNDVMTNPELAA